MVLSARPRAFWRPCICLSFMLPTSSLFLSFLRVLLVLRCSLHKRGVCVTDPDSWQTHKKVARGPFLKSLSCSPPAPVTLPRMVQLTLSHHSLYSWPWVGSSREVRSRGSTHSRLMSLPHLNDFIWYSFLSVVGSIPLFGAISCPFKRFGNNCNPRDI